MNVYCDNGRINFIDEKSGKGGYTVFREDLWEIINSNTWHVIRDKSGNLKYIRCSKLKKSLHQLVMECWYGEEVVREAYSKNFIIEHHDNNGLNCDIRNLSFCNKFKNSAKGLTYDKDRLKIMNKVAVNIFKDFETQLYQITFAFNERFFIIENGKPIEISHLFLLYENHFNTIINDATSIVEQIDEGRKINFKKLNCIKMKYKPMEIINFKLTEEEKSYMFIKKDGVTYVNKDCTKEGAECIILSTPPDESLYNEMKE